MLFLENSIVLLARTPAVLDALLRGLPESWTHTDEGPDTWSPHDVLGHLIHAERTDWMTRLVIVLEHGTARPFDPFDREAMFDESRGRSLNVLLDEFQSLRAANLDRLRGLKLTDRQLALEGVHPTFGRVTARQLLATWTAHDLTHLVQIGRTMARQYREEVGPWAAFLSVMK